MKKINVGIICPSEIAFRRFMPALSKLEEFVFYGIAVANKEEWAGNVKDEVLENEVKKAKTFTEQYGGVIFHSYHELLECEEIDAIYLPLPPALHYMWAKQALENGKHLFLEKPSTTNVKDTQALIELAKARDLAIHENYMFIYHNQIDEIKQMIHSDVVGEIRLIRANFGFPKRAVNDFRYNKALGGGALLDCGGYPIKLLQELMETEIHVDSAKLIYNEQGIDLYGSAQITSKDQIAQISFGMDNGYKCDVEVWGSKGTIRTERVFSAPDSLACTIQININNEITNKELEPDDTFKKSLQQFLKCIQNKEIRNAEFKSMYTQISLVEQIFKLHTEEDIS